MDYFRQHLVDAIEINLERRPYYIQQAGLPALALSHWLVGSEKLCIRFLSPKFDLPARDFIAQGVEVVKNDFVEMEGLPSVDTPPQFTNKATMKQWSSVNKLVSETVTKTRKAVKSQNYNEASQVFANCLEELDVLEEESRVHFAMTKHVIESAAIAALHSPDYIAKNKNVTKLCLDLTKTQIDVIKGSMMMDWLAQKCHVKGAGIIVNDVPHIPFLSEWQNTLEKA